MSRSAFRLLALICVMCLLGIAAVLSLVPAKWTAPEAQYPDMASLRPQVIMMPVPGTSASLRQLAQRPLFFESRRPYLPPTAEAQPEPPPEGFPDAELVGIFGSGEDAGVIVSLKGNAARIRVGMQWSGWELKSVDPVSVRAVFASAGRGDHELRLKRQPQQGGMAAVIERPVLGAADRGELPDDGLSGEVAEGADGASEPTAAQIRMAERRAARAAMLQAQQQRANQQ